VLRIHVVSRVACVAVVALLLGACKTASPSKDASLVASDVGVCQPGLPPELSGFTVDGIAADPSAEVTIVDFSSEPMRDGQTLADNDYGLAPCDAPAIATGGRPDGVQPPVGLSLADDRAPSIVIAGTYDPNNAVARGAAADRARGIPVFRASSPEEAAAIIRRESARAGRPVNATIVAHGSPGSVRFGGSSTLNAGNAAAFGGGVRGSANSLKFVACEAVGDGRVFDSVARAGGTTATAYGRVISVDRSGRITNAAEVRASARTFGARPAPRPAPPAAGARRR
jgi:hypothetical protein